MTDRHLTPEERANAKNSPCAVCMKKASALFFGVLTCHRCKSFFYRITTENITYTCKENRVCFEACKPDNMPKCKGCRYQKCITVGMKPHATFIEVLELVGEEEWAVGELIQKLTALDKRRSMRLLQYYSKESPSLEQVLEYPKCVKMKRMNRNITISAHEWAYLDVYSRITSFLDFHFINELDIYDKLPLFKYNAMRALLLGGAMRTKIEMRDKLTTPSGEDVYPEVVYQIFPRKRLDKVCCVPVNKLIDLNISMEEYHFLMMIQFCNPTIHGLSEKAVCILTKCRDKFQSALVKLCQINYQKNYHSRYEELLRVFEVINRIDHELQSISLLFNMTIRDFPFNRLVMDTFVRI